MNTFHITLAVVSIWALSLLAVKPVMKVQFYFMSNPSGRNLIGLCLMNGIWLAVSAFLWIKLSIAAGWWSWIPTFAAWSCAGAWVFGSMVHYWMYHCSKHHKGV